LHSIPHKQSSPISDLKLADTELSLETPPLSFTESEWGGVDKFWETFEKVPTAENPPTDLGSHTPTEDINNEKTS